MYTREPENSWVFVVDTNQYAGNFERDMVAYMTGMIGDCEVGEDSAKKFYEEMGINDSWYGVDVATCAEKFGNPFASIVTYRPDKNGTQRPSSTYPTEGWFIHGMGGSFREGEEDIAAVDYKEQCLKYAQEKVHPNDAERHRKRWEEQAEQPMIKYPAHLSVACFLSKRPTSEQINIMIERAKKFTDDLPYRGELTRIRISRFLLLREEKKTILDGMWVDN